MVLISRVGAGSRNVAVNSGPAVFQSYAVRAAAVARRAIRAGPVRIVTENRIASAAAAAASPKGTTTPAPADSTGSTATGKAW